MGLIGKSWWAISMLNVVYTITDVSTGATLHQFCNWARCLLAWDCPHLHGNIVLCPLVLPYANVDSNLGATYCYACMGKLRPPLGAIWCAWILWCDSPCYTAWLVPRAWQHVSSSGRSGWFGKTVISPCMSTALCSSRPMIYIKTQEIFHYWHIYYRKHQVAISWIFSLNN